MATQQIEIRAVDKTAGVFSQINARLKSIDKNSRNINNSFGNIARLATGVFAGLGLAKVASGVVNVSRTFEDLRAQLKTVTGSAQLASVAFGEIQKFAATTPFTVDEITKSFTILKRSGLDATTDSLREFGNVAAANGKSFTQLAEAVADASVGEFERLKEFGIKVTQEQEGYAVRLGNQLLSVEDSYDGVIQKVKELGAEGARFGTGMEDRAKTLSGAISNLQDAADAAADAVGRGGLNNGLRELANTFTVALQSITPFAKMVGEELGYYLSRLSEFLKNSNFDMQNFVIGAKVAASVLGGAGLLKAIQGVTNGIKALTLAIARNPFGLLAVGAASLITYLSMENGLGRTLAQVSAVMDVLGNIASKVGKYLKNTFSKVLDTITGAFDSFINGIIDGINAVSEFLGFEPIIKSNSETIRKAIGETAVEAYNSMGDAIDGAIDKGKNWIDNNKLVSDAIDAGSDVLNQLKQSWIQAGYSYDEAEKKARAQYAATVASTNSLTDQANAADLVNQAMGRAAGGTQQLTKAQQQFLDSALGLTPKKLVDDLNKMNEARKAAIKSINESEVLSEQEKQNALTAITLTAENERYKIFEDFQKKQDETFLSSLQAKINNYKDFNQDYFKTAQWAEDKITLQRIGADEEQRKQTQTRIEFEKKSDAEKYQWAAGQAANFFSDLAKVNKKFAKAAKAAAIVQAVINTYQGATKALATYPPPFNFIAAAATVAAGFAQVAAIRAQPAQRGGVIAGGQPAMVGEDGPELIVPKQGATVIPREVAEAVGQLGGNSQPVTVNFNISTVDAQGFDQLLQTRRGTIVGIINRALNERGKSGVTA